MKRYLLILLLLSLPLSGHAEFLEGRDYVRLPEAFDTGLKKGEVQVLEFFWYGCVHCYELEKLLTPWKRKQAKNVRFKAVPAVLDTQWAAHAQAYYAAYYLQVQDKVHLPLFEAIHDKGINLQSKGSLADFIAVKADLDPVAVEEQMNNLLVKSNILEDVRLIKEYRLPGVPSIVVNGKYLTNGRYARNFKRMLAITDHLVAKESQLR